MADRFGKNKLVLQALVLIFLIIGMVDSFKLLKLDVELWGAQREVPSFCNVSEFVNCDAVSMSEYAITLGVPNSAWGLILYALIFIIFVFSFWAREKYSKYLTRFCYVSSFLASIASVVFASISVFVIGAFCILCCVSYIVNFVLLFLIWVYLKENPLAGIGNFAADTGRFAKGVIGSGSERKEAFSFIAVFIGCFLVVLWALIGANRYFVSKTRVGNITYKRVIEEYYLKLPKVDADISLTSSPWGKRGAKVRIIEFSDFKCPFCRKGAFLVRNFLKQYRNEVELVFKNYPLDSSCNVDVGKPYHAGACFMSKTALCADRYGKFWEFHDLLFENAKTISRNKILEAAEKYGINKKEFEDCIYSEKTQEIIGREIEEAHRFNIRGTPTFIINGRALTGLLPPRVFQLILKHELKGRE